MKVINDKESLKEELENLILRAKKQLDELNELPSLEDYEEFESDIVGDSILQGILGSCEPYGEQHTHIHIHNSPKEEYWPIKTTPYWQIEPCYWMSSNEPPINYEYGFITTEVFPGVKIY